MEMLQGQIQGLKSALVELREREKAFIRAGALQEQVEKARVAQDKMEHTLEDVKARRDELKTSRTDILRQACAPLAEAITALLPRGKAVVTLEDGLFIGWEDGERVVPYMGMSSGERVSYDAALSKSFLRGKGEKIIILESAEQDEANLVATLTRIVKESDPLIQWIVNSCHPPKEIPNGWNLVNLK